MKAIRALVVVALIGSLIFNVVAIAKLRKRPIITVNDAKITQKDLDNYLERRDGQQVKAEMVNKTLIEGAAQKAGVMPTEQEVEDAYKQKIEIDWQFAFKAQRYPFTIQAAKDAIRLEMASRGLLYKEAKVTDDDIKKEYDSRPAFYDNPDKARASLALVLKEGDVAEIKGLMEKGTQPSVIMTSKSKQVVFLGNDYVFTFLRQFGAKTSNQLTDSVFNLKKGQVLQIQPGQFAQLGAKAVLVRTDKIDPGSKANLADPKTKKQIREQVAQTQSKPWKEFLNTLWTDMKFESEDPNDKKYIESILFPEKAAAAANR